MLSAIKFAETTTATEILLSKHLLLKFFSSNHLHASSALIEPNTEKWHTRANINTNLKNKQNTDPYASSVQLFSVLSNMPEHIKISRFWPILVRFDNFTARIYSIKN